MNHERRQHHRTTLDRPCKVYHEGSGRYYAARTRDVSAGGVLVELLTARRLEPGDAVRLHRGVSLSQVLEASRGVPASVVRSLRVGETTQVVAIRFEPAASAAAA